MTRYNLITTTYGHCLQKNHNYSLHAYMYFNMYVLEKLFLLCLLRILFKEVCKKFFHYFVTWWSSLFMPIFMYWRALKPTILNHKTPCSDCTRFSQGFRIWRWTWTLQCWLSGHPVESGFSVCFLGRHPTDTFSTYLI